MDACMHTTSLSLLPPLKVCWKEDEDEETSARVFPFSPGGRWVVGGAQRAAAAGDPQDCGEGPQGRPQDHLGRPGASSFSLALNNPGVRQPSAGFLTMLLSSWPSRSGLQRGATGYSAQCKHAQGGKHALRVSSGWASTRPRATSLCCPPTHPIFLPLPTRRAARSRDHKPSAAVASPLACGVLSRTLRGSAGGVAAGELPLRVCQVDSRVAAA